MIRATSEREVDTQLLSQLQEVADTGLSLESTEWSAVIWWRNAKEKAEQPS